MVMDTAVAVPMNKEHDALLLLSNLHGPPVVIDFLIVHNEALTECVLAKVYRILAGSKILKSFQTTKLNCLVVDKLWVVPIIFELPISKILLKIQN